MTKLELEDAYIASLEAIISSYNKMVLLRDTDIWEDVAIWYLVGQGRGYRSILYRSDQGPVYRLKAEIKLYIADRTINSVNLTGYNPSSLDIRKHLEELKRKAYLNVPAILIAGTTDAKTYDEWIEWLIRSANELDLPVKKCLEVVEKIIEEST